MESVVTIGVFDGVHLGHQALIEHNVEVARRFLMRSIVVTFDPNPLEVLRPAEAPTRLCSLDRRVELISALGVDDVKVLNFNHELAAMSPDAFIEEILLDQLDAQHVVIGHGFRFGRKAQGTTEDLRGEGLIVDEYALVGGEQPVSSTRIRAAIAGGDVRGAASLLSRPPGVEGVVVKGEQRGRALGFPTANLEHHPLVAIPADGVYAGAAVVGGRRLPAAISIGTNPTFEGSRRTVEAYLLDFDGDLYGQWMRVEFVERLRGMIRFEKVDVLVEQMRADAEAVRRRMGGEYDSDLDSASGDLPSLPSS